MELGKPVGRTFAKKGTSKKASLGGGTLAGMSPVGGVVGKNFPKNGQDSKAPQSANSKSEKDQKLANGEAASIFKAPTSRVFTNDYQKVGRAPDDKDVASPYLGNPLRR